jgi:hypothetical protein
MNYDGLKAAVLRERDKSRCLSECAAGLEQNELRTGEMEPARVTIGSVLPTWRVRSKTTAMAGADTSGFEETIDVLEAREPDEVIYQGAFLSAKRTYAVFATESGELLGCLRVFDPDAPPEDAPITQRRGSVRAVGPNEVVVRCSVRQSRGFADALGGRRSSEEADIWKIPYDDRGALGRLMASLRDAEFAFDAGDDERAPALVFARLRDQGFVEGGFVEVVWTSDGEFLTEK